MQRNENGEEGGEESQAKKRRVGWHNITFQTLEMTNLVTVNAAHLLERKWTT